MTTTDNAIVLYETPDGVASLEVRLDHGENSGREFGREFRGQFI